MNHLKRIMYYGTDRETYLMCMPRIISHNSRDVCYLSQLFFYAMMIFSVLSLFGVHRQFVWLYIVNTVLFGVLMLISRRETIAQKHAPLLVLLFSCGILGFGISASLADPTMVATAFHVLMIVIAIFFITTIAPMIVILSLGVIGLSISSFISKPFTLATGDLYNGIIFLVIALILHYSVQRDRLRSYINDYILRETRRQLTIKSYYDGLSGLFNRQHFFEVANSLILTDDYTICLLDIDRFKKVNDAYGHHTGDMVIKALGETIQKVLGLPGIENDYTAATSSNTRHTFAGRLGGDEFIMLIGPDGPDPVEAGHQVQTIMSSTDFNGLKGIGISMGYASAGAYPHRSIDMLYRIADSNMYKKKALHHQQAISAEHETSLS